MTNILFLLAGLLVGSTLVYVLMSRRAQSLNVESARRQTQIEWLTRQMADNEEAARKRMDEATRDFNSRIQQERQQQDLMMGQQRQERERQLEQLRTELSRQLELQREQHRAQMAQQSEQFAAQLEAAQKAVEVAAQQVLEQKSTRLKADNAENIGHVTDPLKEAIGAMRKAMDDNAKDSARDAATMRQIIEQMMNSNREIGQKAESLVNVLRRDNKVTGNMGEVILGDLLQSQGLVEGEQYEVQPRLRDANGKAVRNDETGSEMQPDVILHYPGGQDAIIDSKVSLVAYERYVNATNDEERAQALKEHIDSVRRHVNELARKDYSKYVKRPREAVDFVIMFMPFESSLQLALANDHSLWREAFQKKVFVTSEQNLIAILHMIHVAWMQNRQAENQQKVFALAEQLIDRLGDFIKRYRTLGERLSAADKAYGEAANKLLTGNQSVVKKGRELIALGAKENPNRTIPEPEDDLQLKIEA